ncbi:MAG TPA: outer membrane beta-barrel protein, partial [Sphingobacteriaceae bacterium]
MRKTLPFILLLVLLASLGYTQTKSGTIRGTVTDAATGAAIDFAVVTLYSSDKVIKNSMSENGGKFNFANLPYGNYDLKISFIGYLTDTIRNINITATSSILELRPVALRANTQQLSEVTVVEQKPTVEYSADKITFNAGQTLLAEGSVATDLLKNVPMVDVDIDGKATIAGKRNTRIFIDGKPSDFMASDISDLLNVLPSDAIEKIEVITSPPAKYSADGEGIINIELKKGYKIGLNGNVSATGTTRGNYNGSGYLAYRTSKLTLASNYGYRENFRRSSGSSSRMTFNPDTVYYINQNNENNSRNGGQNLRTNLDWDLNAKNNFSISANLNRNRNSGTTHSDYHYINENLVTQSLRKQHNQNNGNSLNGAVNLDYTLKLPKHKDEKVVLGMNYYENEGQGERFFERSFFQPDGTPDGVDPTLQRNDNETGNKGLELNLDYDRALKGNGNSIEMGLRSNFRLNNNDQHAEIYDFAQQTYLTNNALSNTFEFTESLHAAYASFRTRTKNNWGFRAGGRAEMTRVSIQTDARNYELKPYLNFFPNLAVNRFFKKRYNLGITYNMRINRPRENALNPQVENSDLVNISYGNPDLKPSFTHQVDLSLGTYQNKWSLSPRIGFSNTNRIIERIRTVGADGISRTTYENVASSKAYTF